MPLMPLAPMASSLLLPLLLPQHLHVAAERCGPVVATIAMAAATLDLGREHLRHLRSR